MDLIVENLSKAFYTSQGPFLGAGKKVQALSEIDVTLEKGKSLGIVGESGSGKTTLAKILAGFIPADKGTARFGGEDLLRLPHKKRAALIQMVFQDPFSSLNPKLLLNVQLTEALSKHDSADVQNRAANLMDSVGLPKEFLHRYPHQLSGGQRQRFAIARALAPNPSLLIADEPVSSLDLTIQAQIMKLLNELRRKLNLTLLVISHDLAVVGNLCDEVIVMKDGLIVERGPVRQLLTSPAHPYTQRLLNATPLV
jgi:oligopeptide transport system ATP-binding protein